MNRYIHLVKVFMRISLSRKVKIFRMVFILVYASFLVRFIPLRFYYKEYIAGNNEKGSRNMQPFGDQIRLYKKIMLLTPWKITCLVESLSFCIYFKQNDIQIPLFIGIKTGNQMEAHAWNFSSNSLGYSAIEL